MAMTTGHSEVPAGARWHALLRPRWLGWHAFVVVATAGMLLLGDWQLRRAESGNQLSWAYTFEWPLFSAFTVYFWIKSLRDELRGHGAAASVESDSAATAAQSTRMATEATAPEQTAGAASATQPDSAAPVGRRAASWDATSWDATSWDATRREGGADGAGKPVDIARATPADGEAYVARLMAEVRGQGRPRGRR